MEIIREVKALRIFHNSQSKPLPAFINKMNKLSSQNKKREKIMYIFERRRKGIGRGA